MAAERLSKATVAERALRLGDEEGIEAVTIRRLAQELGVTPMALYWHFKNKDELLLGIVDHVMAPVHIDENATGPWQEQLRAMLEAVVRLMIAHPMLADLLHTAVKADSGSLNRTTEDALVLLGKAGFEVQEAYWVASYLLHGAIGMFNAWPDCPASVPEDQVDEWRRQHRLRLESLPGDKFPMMIALASTYTEEPDTERYLRFGTELLMSGVEAAARSRAAVTS